jgi:hypothetical protein
MIMHSVGEEKPRCTAGYDVTIEKGVTGVGGFGISGLAIRP